jgi:hypothetical protein
VADLVTHFFHHITKTDSILKKITLAFAGIALAALTLSGCSAITSLLGDETVVEGEGDAQDIFTIEVGDCINDSAAGESVTTVPTVDCAELHDSEAYKSIILDDKEFPGADVIQTAADDGCSAAFEDFIGLSYDESIVNLNYYYPTAQTWLTGDREILCLARDTDGNGTEIQTTGSLAGAKR